MLVTAVGIQIVRQFSTNSTRSAVFQKKVSSSPKLTFPLTCSKTSPASPCCQKQLSGTKESTIH